MMRLTIAITAFALAIPGFAADPSKAETRVALLKAVNFFRQNCSAGGGYIYQLSADLKKREGEGKVGASTAWLQPPATPSVGLAYLNAYRICGEQELLAAARETATSLIRGQLKSGGWDHKIEFDPGDRKKYAYRIDKNDSKKLRNVTTFDDDKSQSAIRFLMQLDHELKQSDPQLHECVMFALEGILSSQYACGAWPQRYSEFPSADEGKPISASLPDTWSRQYPGSKYSGFYTLNDNTMSDVIETLLDAWDIYGDKRYLASAGKGGDFFLLAQLPEPQPGWAQQYDQDMHPAWARKFEPPAITGGESQGVMRALMMLYRRSAKHTSNAERFLKPIDRAIQYYRRSQLKDGRLARFYELGSNRPLFFTKDYQLTYSSSDMPTHYSFIVSSKLDSIESELKKIRQTPVEKLWKPRQVQGAKKSSSLARKAMQLIDNLDDRGAWVEDGRLRYHGDDDDTRRVIRSDTFAKNLIVLANWLAVSQ